MNESYEHSADSNLEKKKEEELSQKRSVFLKYLLLFFFLCIFLIVVQVIFGSMDGKPPKDQSFKVDYAKLPSYPASQNGYDFVWKGDKLFSKILSENENQWLMDLNLDKFSLKNKKEVKKVGKILKKSQPIFSLWKQAMQKPHYQYSLTSPLDFDTKIPSLLVLIKISNLLRLKCLLFLKEHRDQNALSLAWKHIEWSQKFLESKSPLLISFSLGTFLAREGVENFQRTLEKGDYSTTLLQEWQKKLKLLSPKTYAEALSFAWRTEYTATANTVDDLWKTRGRGSKGKVIWSKKIPFSFPPFFILFSYVFHPNDTKAMFYYVYKKNASITRTSYPEYLHFWKKFEKELSWMKKKGFSLCFSPNCIGKILYMFANPQAQIINPIYYKLTFQLTCLKTIMAIKIYSKRENQLPKKLRDLVPSYLSQIPKDPVEKKPLLYDPKSFCLEASCNKRYPDLRLKICFSFPKVSHQK